MCRSVCDLCVVPSATYVSFRLRPVLLPIAGNGFIHSVGFSLIYFYDVVGDGVLDAPIFAIIKKAETKSIVSALLRFNL